MAFSLRAVLNRGPEIIRAEGVFIREWPIQELGLTLAYILVAAIWCVFSDDVFDEMTGSRSGSAALQAMKGINFVFTTGIVLYLVLRRSFRTRRLAQEASRQNQERFEAVALAATDAIWDLNLDTRVVWWSDGMHKLFGFQPADVSSRFDWLLDRLHPDDRQRVVDAVGKVAESGGSSWNGQYRFRRADGTYALVLDRGFIIRDASKKPLRLVGGISDISERRRAEEALENSRRQLRALTARLQSSREEERASVAREIHDELGQVLTALKLNLDWLERKLGERENEPSLNPLLDRVVESSEIADSAIKTVQRIASDLRPSALDNLGLAEALQEEARKFQQRNSIPCQVQLPAETLQLSREAATAVFRVTQEALTNVARHAQASSAQVRLCADSAFAELQVEDDGVGIRPESLSNPRSLGLLGMRERASVLGGEVAVAPISPRGTRVTLRLPIAAKETGLWADP
jgi:two-component system, NarL family, sensor histidine kinase UhpB